MCSHAFIHGDVPPSDTSGVSHGASKGLIHSFETIQPCPSVSHSPSLCWEVSSSYQAWLHKQDMLKNPKWFDPYLFCGGEGGIGFFQLGVEIKLGVRFSLPSTGMLFATFISVLVMLDKHLAKVHGNGQYANLVSDLIVSSGVLLWKRKTHPSFSVFRLEDRQFL